MCFVQILLPSQQKKASYNLRVALGDLGADALVQEDRFYVDVFHQHNDHTAARVSTQMGQVHFENLTLRKQELVYPDLTVFKSGLKKFCVLYFI